MDTSRTIAYERQFGYLAMGSSGHCRPAVDSLISLHAACHSSGLDGTLQEQHEVMRTTNWVHHARLDSFEQQQQLLACLDGSINSMLVPLSEVVAAGMKQLCIAEASSLLQQHAPAMHHLRLLCAAVAACVQFWCQSLKSDAQGSTMATLIKMSTQIASSGEQQSPFLQHLMRCC